MLRMAWLLLLFVLVPAVELALLIEIGSRIGTLATLGLIALTGMVGAALARHQGLQVLRRVQAELAEARLPAGPLVDGVILLVAGALLITPGVLTDALGFLCLVPGFRGLIQRALWRRFERAVRERRVHIEGFGSFEAPFGPFEDPHATGPSYDLEPETSPEPDPDREPQC